MAIPLGPFQLQHPIGKGGMGVVWLGRHREQDVQVAVKVITGKIASSADYQLKFRREVQAVSSLDHPGVVWIFDYGTIPAESARASNGALVEGSPYLAMEHCSRGTLRELGRSLTWPEMRSILMTLLDALAHAHARGVVHRDLKPDNVLIASQADLRPGFKITDFGIAHPIVDPAMTEDRPVGTPHYMAPEQVRGDQHRMGPHTDLYSLGCVAYRLVCGRLPFRGLKGPSLMYAQLNKEPPALDPLVPVPRGLDDWIRTMMAKDPWDRFRRAADAALALSRLADPRSSSRPALQYEVEPLPIEIQPDPGQEATRIYDRRDLGIDLDTATLKIVTRRKPDDDDTDDTDDGDPAPVDPTRRPPLPATWRMDRLPSPDRLLGAGLGLFGLRHVPFVGREPERDTLWRALTEAHKEGRTRVVVVRGAAGSGKSRLVAWVAERAHEVGGAHVMRASLTDEGSAWHHLRAMVVKFLRHHPLSPDDRERLFGELLSDWDLQQVTLADALDQLLDAETVALHDTQRRVLLRKVLEGLSEDRPLLVFLDDAQWGVEALKLARHLLEARRAHPARLLVVATVLDGLAGYSEVVRRVDEVTRLPGGEALQLGALTLDDRHQLMASMLGFEAGLSAQVEEITQGNPLFAVQVVGGWVQQGVLRSGPRGFALSTPHAPIPTTLSQAWEVRVPELIQHFEPPALELLERAAVLGREVDALEWQAACDDPQGAHAQIGWVYFNPKHARLRKALMDRLVERGLAAPTEAGFAFAHAGLRDAIVTRSRRAGRFVAHSDACARVLAPRRSPDNAERLGELLRGAGRLDEALGPLLQGAEHRRRTRGGAAALPLLDRIEQTLREARIAADDAHWGQLGVERAWAFLALDRTDAAEPIARRTHELATQHGWTEAQAASATVLGAIARQRGETDAAEALYLEAVRALWPGGDAAVSMRAWHQLRQLAHERKDEPLRRQREDEVRATVKRATTDTARAWGEGVLASYALEADELEDALLHATESETLSRRAGDLPAQARALFIRAEVALAAEAPGEAREALKRCAACLEELGSEAATLVRCKLGVLEWSEGRHDQARAAVQPAIAAGLVTVPTHRAACHTVLVAAAAGEQDWGAMDEHLDACEEIWGLVSSHRPEFAEVLRAAGDEADRHRERRRAVRAWVLARDRLEALGRKAEAAALADRIAAVTLT